MIKRLAFSRWIAVAVCLVGALMLASGVASAQTYPTKPITIVIGMEPGGVVDVASRVLMDEAKKTLGQDMHVENRPGASHMVAGAYVVGSKPDGYTIWGATARMLKSFLDLIG